MPIFQLTDTLSVAGQITPEDIPGIAAQGITVVVCNRPDGEVPQQATMDEIEAACNATGLLFVRYPVTAMDFPGPDLEGLGDLFDDPGQSVLAYCRTGTRCANLWVATRDPADQTDAVQIARDIGFDLSMVIRY
ncbi:MAG: TIGR01244 family sulfur transferase [Luminiphilus sp.]|jgi:sulfide:quinone oxidoreductase|nr:TIGR01244 family sulfur transferase [Luminiphilus sp.]MDG2037378.1 TIGR01244 family sulfur transferase [Luminiphilus sp.]RZO80038.1 MAG: TIGR01244 family phosphatase [Halieaceae bacterium]|tara:strand:+ start:24422 stop:24823 length:402 start_codon:yes stop_codon:yes gene_type:complete